jgi:hypothetical protein
MAPRLKPLVAGQKKTPSPNGATEMAQQLDRIQTVSGVRFNLRSLFRACGVVAALSCWYAISMRADSPHTSWESHPYAGPFILLKQSHSVADFLVSGAIACGILIPALLWVRNGSPWAIVFAGAAALVSIGLSYFCAMSASV